MGWMFFDDEHDDEAENTDPERCEQLTGDGVGGPSRNGSPGRVLSMLTAKESGEGASRR
jgi:hypothetical protein